METIAVRGRVRADRWRSRGTIVASVALATVSAFATPVSAAGGYVFTKVVDSAADGFNPQTLRTSCASINTRGDIAFTSDRGAAEDGMYRADAGGGLTTIAEVAPGSGFELLANGHPSMNDSGQVSFGATTSPGGERVVMRGDGTISTAIATSSSETEGFASFGTDTSINDTGEVAFDGRLGSGAEGLFSGSGGATTVHYLDTADVSVDGNPAARFVATQDRPSINDVGDIAFLDEVQGTFQQHVFRGREGSFTTVSASDPPLAGTPPLLIDDGTVVWQTQFLDEAGFAVRAVVKGDGLGTTTTVVDSSGAFDLFHAYAINNSGAVAFSATLDGDDLGVPAVFVGPNPKKDRVIGPGDKLDGGTVAGLTFCEEGLADSGALAFVAEIEDGDGEVRAAVFRATSRK